MNLRTCSLLTALLSNGAFVTAYAGEKIDKSISVDMASTISVHVIRGDVEIKSWDRDEVRVVGELDDATQEFVFITEKDETLIDVRVEDGFFNRSWGTDETDIEVYVPVSSQIRADGKATNFQVSGIEQGVHINSISGDIIVSEVGDKISAETVSGNIEIKNSFGKVKVSTVSGDIETDAKADYFDAQSVSGDIDAKIGKSEIVELSSVSGDLDLDFELAADGRVNAETVSGDVNLNFEDKVNAEFRINTGPGGDIRNSITQDEPKSSFIGAEAIKFSSGTGSASVEITTMSGTISLKN